MRIHTRYLGGELLNDGRSKAFDGRGSYCEGVGGARVQPREHVTRLIGQFHHLAALIGQVELRVEGAQRFVGDLTK